MGEDTFGNWFMERYENEGGVGGWDQGRGKIWRRELGVGGEKRMRERKKKEDPWRGIEGVGICHGFTTGFQIRGAHGCEEQWYARDTRV
jgi:hypothetical protein